MSFSEDFAHLSNRFPGCFFLLGNGKKNLLANHFILVIMTLMMIY